MKNNTSNRVRKKCPCKSLQGVQYDSVMGRLIFVIEEKVLLIFFYCAPIIFFKLAAHELLKIKVCVEPCLVSVVVLMRGCSGTGEYETGKKKITVYSLKKTGLHHWLTGIITLKMLRLNEIKL